MTLEAMISLKIHRCSILLSSSFQFLFNVRKTNKLILAGGREHRTHPGPQHQGATEPEGSQRQGALH